MLKKAGIVVAAATAGLLALSPLAFAGDKSHDHDDKKSSYSHENENGSGNNVEDGIVNSTVQDSNINNCENAQSTEDAASESALALLGVVDLLNNNNVNALQCTNILNNFLNDNEVDVAVLGGTDIGDR